MAKAAPAPVFLMKEDEVNEAFEAFAAMRRLVQTEPGLLDNKYFRALQDTAYARFLMNFEAL